MDSDYCGLVLSRLWLVSIATVARSFFYADYFVQKESQYRSQAIVLARGSIYIFDKLGKYNFADGPYPRAEHFTDRVDSTNPPLFFERLAVLKGANRQFFDATGLFHASPYHYPIRLRCFPLWWLTVCLSVAPMTLLFKNWRRRRCIRMGLCDRCGYDLRATPDRCPECGASTRSNC